MQPEDHHSSSVLTVDPVDETPAPAPDAHGGHAVYARLVRAVDGVAQRKMGAASGDRAAELQLVHDRGAGPGGWVAADGVAVAAVCSAPTPQQRLQWMARGAVAVIDTERPLGELVRRVERLARRVADGREEDVLGDLHSRSRTMRELLADAQRTAATDTSLLLTGETGVGKEHLARAVHASGPRRAKPFVVLNCGALQETLLESQMFGHERGAFTGADRAHKGFFEVADGGTLMLDEIGELPLHLQVKLLTVLERREVVRVGATRPIPVDVRVVAATNRDIAAEVASGAFREDLFYRLNVIHLRLPPLWQRVEDLPEIAGRFLAEHCAALRLGTFGGIDAAALQALMDYPWPGNVRELRNVLERSLVLSGGAHLAFDHLPQEVRDPNQRVQSPTAGPVADPADWQGRTLREVREAAVAHAERAYLEWLLEQTGGRVGKTAERAGIRPRSLYDKMKQHGLRKEQFRGKR
ncbi:MAG: sigma-54 interaction domain-containing protein [Planctomycetota bacterium]